MNVLGIDTSTTTISVALARDGAIIAAGTDDVSTNRTGLLALVDRIVAEASLKPFDIDAVAVGAGPGSFTGLRIGMATAKGIAFAISRPLWAVSSLAALAQAELVRDPAGIVIAVLDARRGEVYAGAYQRVETRTVLVGTERVIAPDVVPSLADHARYTGDAAANYPALAAYPGTWGVTPTAQAVIELALAGDRVDILVGGTPTYIRPSEAEVKYPDGVPGALRKR